VHPKAGKGTKLHTTSLESETDHAVDGRQIRTLIVREISSNSPFLLPKSDLYYLYNLSELSGVRHSTKAAQELCLWAILSVMLMIYYINEPADETVMTPGWLMVRSHGWL
jgi:hypothetical protein